ncbi:SRPBCC family protein [Haloarcula salina]|uniref:SRPBCC family protein n=1 Tax=Haloarcula salina TaxID=1429914 RepID=A0AA41FYW9_9EURY|nr:SRPBCC family protein [Haloarcula salina]MBV0900544.1 SRPBCC family protein [Haloarcula salina]
MERVSLTRTVDADPDTVIDRITDVEPFMRAAGFDDVTVEGDTVVIQNHVGLFQIELVVELIETDAVLTYEQREGIFESMVTDYTVEAVDGGTEVTATTEYTALDLPVLGTMIDSTIVSRQRSKELNRQFDWLDEQVQG